QVRSEADEEAAACRGSGFRKCFGVNLSTAGIIEHDLSILQAVQKRRPLSQQYPNAASTKEISRAAARLLSVGVGPLRDADEEWEDLEALDHYRVLEVVPKASPKEVQSAYQLLKKTYDPETTCLSPLMDAPGLREMQARIEAAYRTLIFLESRSVYDRQLLGSGALKEDQVRGLHAGAATGGETLARKRHGAARGAPAAAPGARDHRREDQDPPGLPAGNRGRALRRPAGSGVRARLPARVRPLPRPARGRCRPDLYE